MSRPRKNFIMVPKATTKSSLSSGAIHLYLIILELSSLQGFTWASNDYLGKSMNTSGKTIQRYVKELKEAGFITVNLYTHTGKTERHIFPKQPDMAVDIDVHWPVDMVVQQ